MSEFGEAIRVSSTLITVHPIDAQIEAWERAITERERLLVKNREEGQALEAELDFARQRLAETEAKAT